MTPAQIPQIVHGYGPSSLPQDAVSAANGKLLSGTFHRGPGTARCKYFCYAPSRHSAAFDAARRANSLAFDLGIRRLIENIVFFRPRESQHHVQFVRDVLCGGVTENANVGRQIPYPRRGVCALPWRGHGGYAAELARDANRTGIRQDRQSRAVSGGRTRCVGQKKSCDLSCLERTERELALGTVTITEKHPLPPPIRVPNLFAMTR